MMVLLMVSRLPGKPCSARIILLEEFVNQSGYLECEERRHGVSDLMVLLRAGSGKKVVVGKGLQARRLPNSEAATLHRVGVNEVMAILGDVGGDRGGGAATELHAKPVVKLRFHQRLGDIPVVGEERLRKVIKQG